MWKIGLSDVEDRLSANFQLALCYSNSANSASFKKVCQEAFS